MMRIENYIRITGILLALGILGSNITLGNGVLLIRQGYASTILVGLAEIFRWSFGLLAAVLLWRIRRSAQWLLLLAFLCGLFGSWVSFIPFAGNLIRLADQTSVIQQLVAIQLPNLFLVLIVFYLFQKPGKSDNQTQPNADARAE